MDSLPQDIYNIISEYLFRLKRRAYLDYLTLNYNEASRILSKACQYLDDNTRRETCLNIYLKENLKFVYKRRADEREANIRLQICKARLMQRDLTWNISNQFDYNTT